MRVVLRNILTVVIALVLGSLANGLILQLGLQVIPPPEGMDMSTPEGLNAAFEVMTFKHFVTPFLAHALGTFVGCLTVAYFALQIKNALTYLVSGVFFIGGLYMVLILQAPMWFNILDLTLAYFPMAWLALKIKEGILFRDAF